MKFSSRAGGWVTPPEGSCFSDGGFAKNEVF